MSTRPQNDVDLEDESSGVTALSPVPVQPARFGDLSESDNTQYFSVKELMDRGKALAQDASPPAQAASQPPLPVYSTPPVAAPVPAAAVPARPSALEQLRDASLARKAILVILPLLLALFVLKPPFKKRAPVAASPAVPAASAKAKPEPTPAPLPESEPVVAEDVEQPIKLGRGVTLQRAAADSVAAGNFEQALSAYRELARREPSNAAYAEAVRILSARVSSRVP